MTLFNKLYCGHWSILPCATGIWSYHTGAYNFEDMDKGIRLLYVSCHVHYQICWCFNVQLACFATLTSKVLQNITINHARNLLLTILSPLSPCLAKKKTLVCQHVELHWIWTGHYSRNKIYACALVLNADACCNGKAAPHETHWSECNSNNN